MVNDLRSELQEVTLIQCLLIPNPTVSCGFLGSCRSQPASQPQNPCEKPSAPVWANGTSRAARQRCLEPLPWSVLISVSLSELWYEMNIDGAGKDWTNKVVAGPSWFLPFLPWPGQEQRWGMKVTPGTSPNRGNCCKKQLLQFVFCPACHSIGNGLQGQVLWHCIVMS